MMVGRLLSYWEGNFSGAMLNFGRVKKVEFYGISLGKIKLLLQWCHGFISKFWWLQRHGGCCKPTLWPYDLCCSWHVPLGKLGCSPFPLRVEGAWKYIKKKFPTTIERMLIERVKLVELPSFFFWEHLSSVAIFFSHVFFVCPNSLAPSELFSFTPSKTRWLDLASVWGPCATSHWLFWGVYLFTKGCSVCRGMKSYPAHNIDHKTCKDPSILTNQ